MIDRSAVSVFEVVGFLINGGFGWLVARTLRPQAAALDAARAQAAAQEVALAEERAHSRQAAVLHDRILQTLEVLATGAWIADRQMRQNVAVKACWLRTFVEGGHERQRASLATELVEVIGEMIGTYGLHVEFNPAQLRELDVPMPPAIVEALAGAVRETLTNVARHSGADHAVLHCDVTDDEVVLSVLDNGTGFDTSGPHRGIGLRESIRQRVVEAGGTVLIESTPGEGTHVEIRWSHNVKQIDEVASFSVPSGL